MARNDLQPYPVSKSLRILQEDIDFGIRQDSYGCMIAHALMRTMPSAVRVRVTREQVAWSDEDDDNRYFYPVTEGGQIDRLIKAFDLGEEVKPVTIHLRNGQFRPVQYDEQHRIHARESAREKKIEREKQGLPPLRPKTFDHGAAARRTTGRYVPDEAALHS